MKQLKAAFEFRRVGPPRSTRGLIGRFDHAPRSSVAALLRKAGPFDAGRDAYRFSNGDPGWPITGEDARVLREHYQRHIDGLSVIGLASLRMALQGYTVSVPVTGTTALPVAVIDFVMN